MDCLGIAGADQERLAGVHVVDEVDGLAPLGLVEKLRDDRVALLRQKGGDKAFEGDILPLHLDAEPLRDLIAEIDIRSDRLGILVQELKRRARHVGAVDNLAGGGDVLRCRDIGGRRCRRKRYSRCEEDRDGQCELDERARTSALPDLFS